MFLHFLLHRLRHHHHLHSVSAIQEPGYPIFLHFPLPHLLLSIPETREPGFLISLHFLLPHLLHLILETPEHGFPVFLHFSLPHLHHSTLETPEHGYPICHHPLHKALKIKNPNIVLCFPSSLPLQIFFQYDIV